MLDRLWKSTKYRHFVLQAFQEFVATFNDAPSNKSGGKVWVKAGTYDAGKRRKFLLSCALV